MALVWNGSNALSESIYVINASGEDISLEGNSIKI